MYIYFVMETPKPMNAAGGPADEPLEPWAEAAIAAGLPRALENERHHIASGKPALTEADMIATMDRAIRENPHRKRT